MARGARRATRQLTLASAGDTTLDRPVAIKVVNPEVALASTVRARFLQEARKVAREICALPAEAVAISRKLLKLPPEDMTRRIDQESHLFGERMHSKEAVAAFTAFFERKKG